MKQLLTDSGDKFSSKRAITFLLVFLLIGVIIGHMFFQKSIAEYVYSGLIEAVIWSMAFIGSEKFVDVIPQMMNRNKRTGINNRPDADGDAI